MDLTTKLNHTEPIPLLGDFFVSTVLPDGSISPSLEQQIVAIEQQLDSLANNKSIDVLARDLSGYAKAATESASAAISAAHYAIVYAWATGCMFNLAKNSLGRGPFGPWRDAIIADTGISVRTSQNWMKLADECNDVRAFLVPGASLTRVYRATGILPDKTSADEHEDGDDTGPAPPEPQPVETVFKALAEGRKRLRHLLEADMILDEEDRDRLEEEKSAFITLVDKLLNPIVP
ncbi:MAG: hypothetical protein ABF308_24545 [Phaeobacter gallaeciensis]